MVHLSLESDVLPTTEQLFLSTKAIVYTSRQPAAAHFISLCEAMAIRAAGDYAELILRDGSAPNSSGDIEIEIALTLPHN